MMRIVMGRNYESLSCYDKAEEMYLQAFHMQPNRLYPLYRMMLLQEAQETVSGLRNMPIRSWNSIPRCNHLP